MNLWEREKLLEDLETLRGELYRLADGKDCLNSQQLLCLSERIDQIILHLMRNSARNDGLKQGQTT